MSKRDTSSPEYRSALSSSLRWDAERKEPYLQLPSFPDLRLTLFREGIVDDLVSPFNSPRLHLISFKRPHCSTTTWSEYAFTAYPTRTSPPFFPTDAEERCRLSMPRSFVEEWFERDYPIHQNILISSSRTIPTSPPSLTPHRSLRPAIVSSRCHSNPFAPNRLAKSWATSTSCPTPTTSTPSSSHRSKSARVRRRNRCGISATRSTRLIMGRGS